MRDAQYETREEGDNLHITGLFATFTGVYNMWNNAIERIDPHAFDGALDDDIRALTNHDSTLVLGRNTAQTLLLEIRREGLWGDILINRKDQDAMNLYARVDRKDVTQCSIGFDILDQLIEDRPDGQTVFTLRKVKLYEVSVCTFPAYEDTAVQARQADYNNYLAQRAAQWRMTAMKRLKGADWNGT